VLKLPDWPPVLTSGQLPPPELELLLDEELLELLDELLLEDELELLLDEELELLEDELELEELLLDDELELDELPPPQATPLSVNAVITFAGGELLLIWKPKVDVPPLGASSPFQLPAGLDAVTVEPDVLKPAFQPPLNDSPAPSVHTRL
jgi:hypothetical protein